MLERRISSIAPHSRRKFEPDDFWSASARHGPKREGSIAVRCLDEFVAQVGDRFLKLRKLLDRQTGLLDEGQV
jgi:hypothetical protein